MEELAIQINNILLYLKKEWVSVLSLIISTFCYIEYRKVNKIALRIDSRTTPKFNVEIEDSGVINKNNEFQYFFAIVVSNLSDSANSICKVSLRLEYEEKEMINEVIISFENNNGGILKTKFEKLPINIEGRNTKLLYVVFPISSKFRIGKKIINYTIEIEDLFKNVSKKNVCIISEVNLDDKIK